MQIVPEGEEIPVMLTDMVCLCQHGTDGPNCETCLQDHWDVAWRRATSQSANECKREYEFSTKSASRVGFMRSKPLSVSVTQSQVKFFLSPADSGVKIERLARFQAKLPSPGLHEEPSFGIRGRVDGWEALGEAVSAEIKGWRAAEPDSG